MTHADKNMKTHIYLEGYFLGKLKQEIYNLVKRQRKICSLEWSRLREAKPGAGKGK